MATTQPASTPVDPANFHYREGGANWPKDFPGGDMDGKNQSPVEYKTGEAIPAPHSLSYGPGLSTERTIEAKPGLRFKSVDFEEKEDESESAAAPPSVDLEENGKSYQFDSLHMHYKAEHPIDASRHDGEVHIKFKHITPAGPGAEESKTTDPDYGKALALGIFLSAVPGFVGSRLFEILLEAMTKVVESSGPYTLPASLNLGKELKDELGPDSPQTYLRYIGSLTTPLLEKQADGSWIAKSTDGQAIHVTLFEPLKISEDQLARFKDVVAEMLKINSPPGVPAATENVREPQPLFDRKPTIHESPAPQVDGESKSAEVK